MHELLLHFIIEFSEIFNYSIKPKLYASSTKVSKLPILFTAHMVLVYSGKIT